MHYKSFAAIIYFAGILLFFSFQKKPDFISPIKYEIKLAGSFGELRPNHFHSGIDIKGSIGTPIYAMQDGYISRIKIERGGYGKVLYITHPNGYTTVYAHLNHFQSRIENYVQKIQHKRESYTMESFPAPDKFPIKKGEEIAKMGMTGRAYGPHLHLEIRDTKTAHPINPLQLGLKIKDHKAPKMHAIKVYELNKNLETKAAQSYALHKSGHQYSLKEDTILTDTKRTGIALKVYDHMDGVPNWNGIYKIQLLQDDSLVFEYSNHHLSFAETRYINAHLDYAEQVANNSYFNRCFRLPGNHLSMYKEFKDKGIILLKKNQSTRIQLIATDANNNVSKTSFWLKRTNNNPIFKSAPYQYFLPYDQENIIENNQLKIRLPKGTLYHNLYMTYAVDDDGSDGIYSSVFQIDDYKTPAHKYFDIGIRTANIPDNLKEKAFIAYCQPDNNIVNYGGHWKGDFLQAKVRDFGAFYIMTDTEAPTIKAHHFQYNMKKKHAISFTVKDNYPTAGKAKGLKYKGYIDGKWQLMEMDIKKDRITWNFPSNLKHGKHIVRIIAKDGHNNQAVFEKEFVY